MNKEFETYQPSTIRPNGITTPLVFNGYCLVRRYKVTVEEIAEDDSVIAKRLQEIWDRRSELGLGHSSNIKAMTDEARKLDVDLESSD